MIEGSTHSVSFYQPYSVSVGQPLLSLPTESVENATLTHASFPQPSPQAKDLQNAEYQNSSKPGEKRKPLFKRSVDGMPPRSNDKIQKSQKGSDARIQDSLAQHKDGDFFLHQLIREMDVDGVSKILRRFPNHSKMLEVLNKENHTPLYLAILQFDILDYLLVIETDSQLMEFGWPDDIASRREFYRQQLKNIYQSIIFSLLEAGADPNARPITPDEHWPVLWIAVCAGWLEIVQVLVQKGASLLFNDAEKNTILHVAVNQGHLDILQFLVEYMASLIEKASSQAYEEVLSSVLEWTNQYGQTLLVCAFLNNQKKAYEWLAEKGAKIDLSFHRKKEDGCCIQASLLQCILQSKNILALKDFLKIETKRNTSYHNLYTPFLATASMADYQEMAEILLDCILNRNAGDHQLNEDFFKKLIMQKAENAFILLLNNGKFLKKINEQYSKGLTALHCAVIVKFYVGVKLLLEKGAKMDIADDYGRIPLHYAVKFADKNIIHPLLDTASENKINIFLETKQNRTPFKSLLERKKEDRVIGINPDYLDALAQYLGSTNDWVERLRTVNSLIQEYNQKLKDNTLTQEEKQQFLKMIQLPQVAPHLEKEKVDTPFNREDFLVIVKKFLESYRCIDKSKEEKYHLLQLILAPDYYDEDIVTLFLSIYPDVGIHNFVIEGRRLLSAPGHKKKEKNKNAIAIAVNCLYEKKSKREKENDELRRMNAEDKAANRRNKIAVRPQPQDWTKWFTLAPKEESPKNTIP